MLEPLSHPPAPASGHRPAAATNGALERALLAFCSDASVAWCAAIGEDGTLLGTASPRGFAPRHPGDIATLAIDFLRSAQRLSAQLGEHDFRGLFQAGDRWHTLVSPLTDGVLLLAVFDRETLPALVRAAAESARPRIVAAI